MQLVRRGTNGAVNDNIEFPALEVTVSTICEFGDNSYSLYRAFIFTTMKVADALIE